jgi:hypothetical protein
MAAVAADEWRRTPIRCNESAPAAVRARAADHKSLRDGEDEKPDDKHCPDLIGSGRARRECKHQNRAAKVEPDEEKRFRAQSHDFAENPPQCPRAASKIRALACSDEDQRRPTYHSPDACS